MTNPPAVLQGTLVQPQKLLDPASVPAHNFANVLRRLVSQSSGIFKTEGEVHSALDAVDAFERFLVPVGDRSTVSAETDVAPREDVSKRVAPQTSAAVVPAGVPQIDYAALAAALIAAEKAVRETAPDGQESPSDSDTP